MARAICTQCKQEVPWFGGKGCRLENASCPYCGGKLQGKTAGKKGPLTGRKSEICVVCKKRVFRLIHPKEPFRKKYDPNSPPTIYPVGSPCCDFFHEVVPLDYINPLDLTPDTPDWNAAIIRVREFRKAAGMKYP